ncbi:MAG: DUF4190 domain-containing protein [Anaerolineales bacterium]|nr:DUF4190 domain-containing protein [Chloroflexota bacterium]MBL6980771.1 DUF4190 domain-containing protein [Anaerolineales bacterium]
MSEYNDSPQVAPNSSTAILCLVAGILGLTIFPVIGSIVALITGPMAKREIKESGGTLGGESLAQVGVILGWIGITLTVLGVCVFGALFAIPFCLAAFGIAAGEFNSYLPLLYLIV